MPLAAPDFIGLFEPGAIHPSTDGDSLRVRVVPGVPLSLPSGRVIAMEPFLCGFDDAEKLAFDERVAPGTYPVVLVMVDVVGEDGKVTDTRVAAARLEIRDEPVVSWELALRPGQDAAGLSDDEYFGYPVDGGTGCFVDAQTFEAIGEEEDFADRVVSAMWEDDAGAPGPKRTPDPVTLAVEDDGHAVVVFSTGWGDGVYPTWIGRTADGDVACFLTDFDALFDEDDPC
ncbi:DUF4241 domain-containing protein [Streptantibioticus cattleyicolor]|uniref:DUF4241 domain-containing protein n=1 Tax=Streptantibioticus cattleyicolor (strain ATCC 35852 / DSM 46488 / JCM 4925 / NBRC 14057 / NRRL 8057) TaxID=1003195 RepID=F8JK40_STREN|nr:DUF4241 domain-containing protein [Streptantibioticus cattleyicolor]AEW99823.1 hypothetical protein SCATT_p16300 [Streptantibioticus cattleyicolor NRRL 8057 = DSM 46488]CCB71141.1 conserved protein of unknown function [Streptantibioticus cattleyicolor NRRL 8057 = DSM 46488]